jgi:hypothetical protein
MSLEKFGLGCLPKLSYPYAMRHLLLALMIVLLPIRGWVGNAMAINMAAQQVLMTQGQVRGATLVSGADKASVAASTMPDDCPMNAQIKDGKSGDGDQPVETASSCNCNSCELCAALASFTFSTLATAAFTPHAEPPSRGSRFSSAERVFSLKPPIA